MAVQCESQEAELRELREAGAAAARREQTLARLLESSGVSSMSGQPVDRSLAAALLSDGSQQRVMALTEAIQAVDVQALLDGQLHLKEHLMARAH
eukprot:3429477-Prymnesium_polylepis.1